MKNRKTVRILLAALLCYLLFGAFAVTALAGEGETHAVTFWLDDGVPYEGQDQEVSDGSYAVVPLTPEKENAVFRRWTLENGERQCVSRQYVPAIKQKLMPTRRP